MPKVAQPVERHAVSVMCPAHAKWSLSALFLSDAMWCPKLEAMLPLRAGQAGCAAGLVFCRQWEVEGELYTFRPVQGVDLGGRQEVS